MKYITEKGLQEIRAAAERAYARGSKRAMIPVLPLLALLDDIAAQLPVAGDACSEYVAAIAERDSQ